MKKTAGIRISSTPTSTDGQNANELKQIRESNVVKNFKPSNSASADIANRQQEQQTQSRKNQRPSISSSKSQLKNNDMFDDQTPDDEVAQQNSLPLKLFDGKKQSLDELNAESMTYIWMRRLKEIFLHMNDGRNDTDEIDPFVEFDMKLAKADMDNACDRYIENERIAVMKQRKHLLTTTTSAESVDDEMAKKIDLEKKQEWDMKKLYVEVFKMSYQRNRLKTRAEQDELVPTKTGDDRPNFRNAIWWYSCDKASIYYQINSIVRLENFELLMAYRYYLSDICRLIDFMYRKKKKEGDVAHTLYRADNMNENLLKMMAKKQKGQFISLHGFISTTFDINIAKGYARKQRVYEGNVRVLFVISIKSHTPCTAFAYIDRISFHPEEKEVLFSMGSSFVIEKILEPVEGENYHTIHMTACEIDKSLAENIQIKVANCSPSGRAVLLARYLIELGEYRAARKYLTSLLTEASDGGILYNDISLAGVYSCLGLTYARQGLHADALKAFRQALNTQARLEYSNNNALAEIHNNIGSAYIGLGHLDEAEATFDKAIRMQLREPRSNQQFLASIYSNIGYVHYKQKKYDEAEKAYRNAEKFFKQNTSRIAHDALELSLMKAEFLTNYGRLLCVHKNPTNNRKPEDLYNEALKLYKSILSDGDPKLMQTYMNIMLAFVQTKSYDEVTKCFNDPTVQKLIDKQEANMFELNSSITQTTLGSLYELVGACYASNGFFDKAIQIWKDAYLIERKARLERLLLVTTDGNLSILTTEHNRLIHEWYRKAVNHYTSLSSTTNHAQQEQRTQFSNNLCLGLLYAKLHNHNNAMECLTKAIEAKLQSDKEMLFVAYLLMADMFKRRQSYEMAIANFDQALRFIQLDQNQTDIVLNVEVKLARIECHKDHSAIVELLKLEHSLKLSGSDTKYICLKVIFLDALARYCLKQREYTKFDYAIDQSIALKQGSLSQYHPSLVIDFVLRAEYHVQQAEALRDENSDKGEDCRCHYREALMSYERALEVYTLNVSNNNLDVKKIYYAMGDIMCDMDELSSGMEKYDIAEANNYSDVDDNTLQTSEGEDLDESVEIWMARASMHRHLGEYYARKQAYRDAIVEMTQAVELYSQQLPSSLLDPNVKHTISYDMPIFVANLRHLAECYVYLGDILGITQNEEDGYFVAINIYTKLMPYDKSLEKDEALLYEKISVYYDKLGDHEEALEFFQKAVELGDTSIAALYRLGHLNDICHKWSEAEQNYRALYAHPSIREHKQLKQIIQEKLNTAQILKNSQNQHSKGIRSTDNDTHHSDLGDSLQKRRPSTISKSPQENIHDLNTNVSNGGNDPSNDRLMAAAYVTLQDSDMAIKFYQKDIKQRNEKISNQNIFKIELEKIDQASYTINQQNILPVLPKLFHSLVNEIQKIITRKDSDVSILAYSFVQCGIIHSRLSSHLKAMRDFVAAFGWYASESGIANHQLKTTLIDMMRNLLDELVQHKLKPKRIIDTYIQLSLPNEADRVRLRLLAMHHNNELDDIDDIHGTSSGDHESHTVVLQHYKALLMRTNDIKLKGVCYYNVLRLYKHHVHPDQFGKDIIDGLVHYLPKFNILDRHLLSALAIDFLHEYGKSIDNHTLSQNWQTSVKGSLNNEQNNDKESYIGLSLSDIGDLSAAETYWRSIIKRLEGTFSSRVLDLVHDSDTTLKEIIYAMEHFERDNMLLCNQLIITYEKLGDYYIENGSNGIDNDKYSLVNADDMYRKALNLLKRLNINSNRTKIIKEKLHITVEQF